MVEISVIYECFDDFFDDEIEGEWLMKKLKEFIEFFGLFIIMGKSFDVVEDLILEKFDGKDKYGYLVKEEFV